MASVADNQQQNNREDFESEFLSVARQILEKEKRPMGTKEIVSEAIRNGLFSDKRAGKTPFQTMKSKLSVHIRKLGDKSFFVRTGPGKFYLRSLIASEEIYEAPPLLKARTFEKVLLFKSDLLNKVGRFQGLSKDFSRYINLISKNDAYSYMDRMEAESNNIHKQILTYILVTKGQRLLCYKRGNFSRVEDYLRGSYCVGFGGHVTEEDHNLFGSNDLGITNCAIRELSEELKLPQTDKKRLNTGVGLSIIGAINDDSSIIGQRHFAFIFRYEVSDDPYWEKPEKGENAITQLQWILPGTPSYIWNFEYWSHLCLRVFFSKHVLATPAYRIRRRRPLEPPNIICVIGNVGSGKSLATRVLCNEYNYIEINTGKVLADVLGVPPVPKTPREIFQMKALSFILKPNGINELANAIYSKIRETGSSTIVIDGIRQKKTLDVLRSLVGKKHLGLLYVYTVPDIAFKLYQRRESEKITMLEFLNVRNAEVEKEVEDMIGISDAVLYNWFGEERYKRAVRDIMHELL